MGALASEDEAEEDFPAEDRDGERPRQQHRNEQAEQRHVHDDPAQRPPVDAARHAVRPGERQHLRPLYKSGLLLSSGSAAGAHVRSRRYLPQGAAGSHVLSSPLARCARTQLSGASGQQSRRRRWLSGLGTATDLGVWHQSSAELVPARGARRGEGKGRRAAGLALTSAGLLRSSRVSTRTCARRPGLGGSQKSTRAAPRGQGSAGGRAAGLGA